MAGSLAIGEEQIEVHLAIDHCVVMASELLQFRSMRELMRKSWFRRYCSGDASEAVFGVRMMRGGEQSRGREMRGEIVNMVSVVLVFLVSVCGMLTVTGEVNPRWTADWRGELALIGEDATRDPSFSYG